MFVEPWDMPAWVMMVMPLLVMFGTLIVVSVAAHLWAVVARCIWRKR